MLETLWTKDPNDPFGHKQSKNRVFRPPLFCCEYAVRKIPGNVPPTMLLCLFRISTLQFFTHNSSVAKSRRSCSYTAVCCEAMHSLAILTWACLHFLSICLATELTEGELAITHGSLCSMALPDNVFMRSLPLYFFSDCSSCYSGE